jgi:hypothetical protein
MATRNRLHHNATPLNAPKPMHGTLDAQGIPNTITRHGQTIKVVALQDQWRIDDEWWREQPVSRMYFQLQLEDGSLFEGYHDLITDKWFEQRDAGPTPTPPRR